MMLPPRAADRARAFLRGEIDPAPARPAATVALVRDGRRGLEVYLLRRAASMAFAPRMHVFPGGSVEVGDADQPVPWAGPEPHLWAAQLGCDARLAGALVCAAVRETFEESGVLLGGPSTTDVVADTTGAQWEEDRIALIARTLSFIDFLARRSLLLRSDLLRPWAHWVTPEFEPRRYDTRFFVAAVPDRQRCREVAGEADAAMWLPVRSAIAFHEAGELAMLPPTAVTLRELSSYAVVAEVMSAQRRLLRLLPRPVLRDGELALEWE